MRETLIGQFLSYAQKVIQSQNLPIFNFNSIQYNQYVQTHMSWQEDKDLINQQQIQISSRVHPVTNQQENSLQSHKSQKFSKLIKMPIPLFEVDKMNESDQDDYLKMKISLGVQKQNSFLINSKMSQKINQIKTFEEVETQTDDFTYVNSLFEQAKVYQIPVQMQISQQKIIRQTKQVQTDQIEFVSCKKQIQDVEPAVRKWNSFRMQSGLISISAHNFSFQNQHFYGEGIKEDQQQQYDREFILYNGQEQFDEQDEELLLQDQQDAPNKEVLFHTARFQSHFHHYENYTPPKLKISGCESSPDANPMQMSERDINMMQMINDSNKINQQEYEHLLGRFHEIQQQNIEKNDQIQQLNEKISSLEKQLNKINVISEEKQILERDYKKLQKQLLTKSQHYERLQQQLQNHSQQFDQNEQKNNKKYVQLEDIITQKQTLIQSLLQQVNFYKQSLTKEQEKFNKQIETLETFLQEKSYQIKQIKHQHDKKYEIYIISIKEMKEKIQQYELIIEKLQNDVSSKEQKIMNMKNNSQKLKEQNVMLSQKIFVLKEQIKRPSFAEENSNSKNAQKLEQTGRQVISSESQSNMEPQQATIFIQQSNQTSKFVTYSFQKPYKKINEDNQQLYIQELEKIVLIYQNIIETKIQTIQELEQKVLEFLKDALTNENQAEFLSSQLCQYENKMNSLLVEKLDMQLQNQRLKKMITESENKLSILGSRLIKLAKSNSTISFMERNQISHSSLEQRTQ